MLSADSWRAVAPSGDIRNYYCAQNAHVTANRLHHFNAPAQAALRVLVPQLVSSGYPTKVVGDLRFGIRHAPTCSLLFTIEQQHGEHVATTVTVPEEQLEDPLDYLPCSRILAYAKGQSIYNQQQPLSSLNLIIEGKVRVSRTFHGGRQIVVDIYHQDEFFGESVFLAGRAVKEGAIAMERTKLMSWSLGAVADIMAREPKLGIALLQLLALRSLDYGERLESFSVDNIARRLARSLVRFSERLGEEQEDGAIRMMPFTHELLSQVVGTSREIVTHYMNHFRRQGYLQYSRREMLVHRDALCEWLRQPAA